MKTSETKLAAQRKKAKTSITASLIDTAQAQSEKESELLKASLDFLGQPKFAKDRFPLESAMYWKLQAGVQVNPGIVS